MLGGIEFKADNSVEFSPDTVQELKNIVDFFMKNPIVFQDIWDQKTGSFTMVETPVSPDDPILPLAFKDWLIKEGYEVVEEHPEELEEIRKLLAEFPEDNPDKKIILSKLLAMSRLEISALLEGLRKINND